MQFFVTMATGFGLTQTSLT